MVHDTQGIRVGPGRLERYDIVVVGAGMAGMACAARAQAAGLTTLVLESHGRPGGCAGYFTRRGFSFDVGATTLVDFEPGGVGGEFLEAIGVAPTLLEFLPGYEAWLPSGRVRLHRCVERWSAERLRAFGDSARHRALWAELDELAALGWRASRRGLKLPIRSLRDVANALRSLGVDVLTAGRWSRSTLGDLLRRHGLRGDAALCGLLSILVEDTVHATLDEAPVLNAALGITIRGAGLARASGGMRGFWKAVTRRYRELGGELVTGCPATRVAGRAGAFTVETPRGSLRASHVCFAVPAEIAARCGPPELAHALEPHLRRNELRRGGALALYLGVPEAEVGEHEFTHHQVLLDDTRPLGDGNNSFVSVSSPGDLESAPPGHRAVMISTHCEVEPWQRLSERQHLDAKQRACEQLLRVARRVYPRLAENAAVLESATPCTYERFTGRPMGAVGGYRLSLANSNQHAIAHDIGPAGIWLAGDTTWPGLGTVACVLGARLVSDAIVGTARVRSALDGVELEPRRPMRDLLGVPPTATPA